MSDTIQDLYDSFAHQMEPIQEDDRYFRYLFEMAQASDTTIDQKREELVKVVDEEWISMIEDSLDAINAIIEKPRRFITTEEEVVPVSLAKKISADSVRHLSQNTQFLAPSDDGGIHPTKILNVNMAETYDLYENRFVYHLIQRLLTFVDKRTDVIFWSTGNEIRNRFTMHSKIDDAYEEIEYNVEMTVKDRQSFAENDADNIDTFMRIDRVRRLVMGLRNASFCQIMQGCAAVRSPIQRTNLIMKDPNYRKCYQLWQFMERYDSVGYTIDVKDSAMAFDDEYMVQMYTNLINNYTVFKSLLSDDRNLEELASVKHEPVKPKFVKEIKEELVDSPDIPDVEVRRVFVEEVTQAQLDAEAALAAEREKTAELESQLKSWKVEAKALTDERDDLADELDMAKTREVELMQRAQIAEADLEEARDSLADAEEAKRDAEAGAQATRAEATAQIDAALDDAAAKVKAAKAEAAEEVEAVRRESDAQVEAARRDADAQVEAAQAAAQAARQDAEAEVAAARVDADARVDDAKAEAQAARDEAAAQVDAAVADAVARVQAAKDAADAEIEQARSAAADEMAKLRIELEAAQTRADEAEAASVAEREAAAERLSQAREDAQRELEDRLAAAKVDHAAGLEAAQLDLQQRIDLLEGDLKRVQRELARAQKRVEANSLSHYLLAKLRGADGDAAVDGDGGMARDDSDSVLTGETAQDSSDSLNVSAMDASAQDSVDGHEAADEEATVNGSREGRE